MHYDAIVVGAGPAGSTLARHLARTGASVLLLDRAAFPRDKPCGGGVTLARRLAPGLDLSSVTEQTICDVRITYRLGRAFRHHYPLPLAYMTERCRLDAFLAEAGRSRRRRVPRGRARAIRGGQRPSRRGADGEKAPTPPARWRAPTASTASWDATRAPPRESTWRWLWKGTCLSPKACGSVGRKTLALNLATCPAATAGSSPRANT